MKRVVSAVAMAIVICGLTFAACGGKKQAGAEGSNLNVPGKAGAAKTADLNAQEKLFRDQYVAQCKTQMKNMPPDATMKKSPDEVCSCVGDKVWGMSKYAAQSGEQVDPALVQKEMMACLGIDMKAFEEDMNKIQEMKDRMDAAEMPTDGGDETLPDSAMDTSEPPQLPEGMVDEQEADDARPAPANRNYKYDPKTGKWSN